MGEPWGRGVQGSFCCHWPESKRERGGGGKRRDVSHMWKKSIAVHTHTGLVSSWDYCSALRSDGGNEGMNR